MENYIKLSFDLAHAPGFADILMYELGEIGFESFEEGPTTLDGYIRENQFNPNQVNEVLKTYGETFPGIGYKLEKIEGQNWNATWESDYTPIEIDQLLRIRANFHNPNPAFEHEIVIVPKMSFGTGHHETTRLMAQTMHSLDFRGKKVLDMGCGTGILAIYAEKLGATQVWAIDIEEPAYENTLENSASNSCRAIHVEKGGVEKIPPGPFNVILANINRNVLLEQIPVYAQKLEPGGYLLLSGFFNTDAPVLKDACVQKGMDFVSDQLLNNWACLLFRKVK